MNPLKKIEHDLIQVDKQIQATFYSETMSAKDKRITLEGFERQKIKLLAEKRKLTAGRAKDDLLEIKVIDATEVQAHHAGSAISESSDRFDQGQKTA